MPVDNTTPPLIIHHSADYDGIFCREIAKKFVPDAELVGWDFADKPLDDKILGQRGLIIMDLPVDRVFGLTFKDGWICRGAEQVQPIDRWDSSNVTWIDHHKSSIDSHPPTIPGYRIDGVAACRLAWVWFNEWRRRRDLGLEMPTKKEFIDREVVEPTAVRLAGEYDIWDKRDHDAETFQYGLRSMELLPYHWEQLLDNSVPQSLRGTGMEATNSALLVRALLQNGHILQRYQRQQDATVVKRAFDVEFEGKRFLALNTARCNSLTFEAAAQPHHDGLMGFYWTGKEWSVSLYHSPLHQEHDLSAIAVKFGGGGHRGACGFKTKALPFVC